MNNINENTATAIGSLSQNDTMYNQGTLYKQLVPMELIFETVHPEDTRQNVIISIFQPNHAYNSTMSSENPNNPSLRKLLHKHDYFELMYVINGTVYQNIEHQRHLYCEGSLCLLNLNIHHAEEFDTDFRCLFISLPVTLIQNLLLPNSPCLFDHETKILKESLLYDFFEHSAINDKTAVREYIDFVPCPNNIEKTKKRMYNLFEQITEHFLSPRCGSTNIVYGLLLQIFEELLNKSSYQTIPINIGTEKEARIFDAINNRLHTTNGRISRAGLEKELHYSGAYLNIICKKYTGLNLFSYGTTLAIKKACELLKKTDLSISEIVETLSFSNRSHFYRLFKKQTGMTPANYRKNVRRNIQI